MNLLEFYGAFLFYQIATLSREHVVFRKRNNAIAEVQMRNLSD